MKAGKERKAELCVKIDEDLRVKMIRLRIRPGAIVNKALEREVKRVEQALELGELQAKDPRLTMDDLKSRSARTRRLRGL
ncbi:MAG: hypothetical protein LYZ69_03395 [Nitrososphaerales archaeon]|nr:hypothetical protein [Nitrososphaerales archaeon]